MFNKYIKCVYIDNLSGKSWILKKEIQIGRGSDEQELLFVLFLSTYLRGSKAEIKIEIILP